MKEIKYKLDDIFKKCVDPDAICAHSFQGKCLAKKYKYFCEQMKQEIPADKISKVLGN